MKILGIDPGSRKAGYALIALEGKKIQFLQSGVLRYEKIPQFLHRLSFIYDSCLELVKEYRPDEVAIESLIYVKSVTSLAKLAQARGAMIAGLTALDKYKIHEYGPNLIKSVVAGYGHADKASIDKTLTLILGQRIQYQTHDESDAVAIAICHALCRNNRSATHGKTNRGLSLKQAFKHLEAN